MNRLSRPFELISPYSPQECSEMIAKVTNTGFREIMNGAKPFDGWVKRDSVRMYAHFNTNPFRGPYTKQSAAAYLNGKLRARSQGTALTGLFSPDWLTIGVFIFGLSVCLLGTGFGMMKENGSSLFFLGGVAFFAGLLYVRWLAFIKESVFLTDALVEVLHGKVLTPTSA
jgi:hypothetical protein